jgi:hypothetical protein
VQVFLPRSNEALQAKKTFLKHFIIVCRRRLERLPLFRLNAPVTNPRSQQPSPRFTCFFPALGPCHLLESAPSTTVGEKDLSRARVRPFLFTNLVAFYKSLRGGFLHHDRM